jgi:hypothetical protein
MTLSQRHTTNLNSGQFEQTNRHLFQRNKKINFYSHLTFGTFAFAANAQNIPEAKAKEPNLLPSITTLE